MYGLDLLALLLTIVSYRGGQTANRNLTFMFVTSFGQNGFNASGVIPGADLALEHINGNSTILPGYDLIYDQVRDSQVRSAWVDRMSIYVPLCILTGFQTFMSMVYARTTHACSYLKRCTGLILTMHAILHISSVSSAFSFNHNGSKFY